MQISQLPSALEISQLLMSLLKTADKGLGLLKGLTDV